MAASHIGISQRAMRAVAALADEIDEEQMETAELRERVTQLEGRNAELQERVRKLGDRVQTLEIQLREERKVKRPRPPTTAPPVPTSRWRGKTFTNGFV